MRREHDAQRFFLLSLPARPPQEFQERLYPALLKLEQEGLITSQWGVSDNNRKAKFYTLTRAGRKQIERDTRQWAETSAIMTRFLASEE